MNEDTFLIPNFVYYYNIIPFELGNIGKYISRSFFPISQFRGSKYENNSFFFCFSLEFKSHTTNTCITIW